MKNMLMRLTALLAVLVGVSSNAAHASETGSILTGTTKLACDALLCLSGRKPPEECDPGLSHFFGIKRRKLSDTLNAREAFLGLCPVKDDAEGMRQLARALARGAGRCDAATLNQTLRRSIGLGGDEGSSGTRISDEMPSYCAAYILNAYTDLKGEMPRYVGKPDEDGFWADPKDYLAALARYEREQARKKAARENAGWGGN